MGSKEDDENRRELVAKLVALARRKYGHEPTQGTWESMFASYDRNKDGRITAAELTTLLEDADVGNFLTQQMWVEGIMSRVDLNGDGITLDELMTMLKHGVDVDLMGDGLKRVQKTLDGFVPSMPSFGDGGMLLLLGLGLLVLTSKR